MTDHEKAIGRSYREAKEWVEMQKRLRRSEMQEHYDELNAGRLREIDAGTRHPANATQIFLDHIWVSNMIEEWYPEEDAERPWVPNGGYTKEWEDEEQ